MAVLMLRLAAILFAKSLLFAGASPVGYVGSKACFGCHPAIFKSFEKTGMGRSMTAAGSWTTNDLPSSATISQPGSARTFSVSHNDSGWRQGESEEGVFSVAAPAAGRGPETGEQPHTSKQPSGESVVRGYSIDYPLAYAVGSGFNGLTFLIRRGNYLFQAPVSYYTRTQAWGLSPGYETVVFGFGRKVPQECINCHAGRPSPSSKLSGAYEDPPFAELPIGCENCHGPGEAHIKALGKVAGTIVNPSKLPPALADNICLSCHQSGDARVTQPGKTYLDFRPGEWLSATAVIFKLPRQPGEASSDLLEHDSSMRQSRCFRSSGGKLSCLTCHNPHIQPAALDAPAYYRPKCFTCHNDRSCRLSLDIRKAQSPPDNCIGCHMPKRNVVQVSHSSLTNHRILARADESLPPETQPTSTGLVFVNPPDGKELQLSKITLLKAYQQVSGRSPELQNRYVVLLQDAAKTDAGDQFVQAALGDQAFSQNRFEDAVSHFKSALPDNNAAIYLELGESLAKLGRTQDAIEYLKKGVDIDPYDAVMQKTLILQYINQKSYDQARRSMQQYVETFPEDSFMRSMLARIPK